MERGGGFNGITVPMGAVFTRAPVDEKGRDVKKYLAVLWMLALFLHCHSTMETLNLTV